MNRSRTRRGATPYLEFPKWTNSSVTWGGLSLVIRNVDLLQVASHRRLRSHRPHKVLVAELVFFGQQDPAFQADFGREP